MAPRTPSILTLVAISVALGCGGCARDRETTLSRTARQRRLQSLKVQRERLESERQTLVRLIEETTREIGDVRVESVRVAARLRAMRADLDHELERLRIAEQDLEAARARGREIEKELRPLRALEKTLRDQASLKAAAEQKVALLKKELAATEAAAKKATAELQPKIDAMGKQLAEAQRISKALDEARAAMLAAAKLLAPPPKKK